MHARNFQQNDQHIPFFHFGIQLGFVAKTQATTENAFKHISIAQENMKAKREVAGDRQGTQ